MEVQFDKARPGDYDEVIDLGNYVFSHAHRPHDFPAMLPKIYRREYFMDGIHYLAREDGKIKAMVGAYPMEWEFSGQTPLTLPGRGIGMVSVHPYSRSRGYMKELMKAALDDMRRDGIVFSCLSGRRQRYEHFGFSPAGSAYTFTCSADNIRHTLGAQGNVRLIRGQRPHSGQQSSGALPLSLKPVGPGDEALLDQIHALHESGPARFKRRRDRLYDILSSWKNRILAVNAGEHFEGYLIYGMKGTEYEITEINLLDLSILPEVLDLFLCNEKTAGIQDSVKVTVSAFESKKIAALSRFAESYIQNPAYQFAVFDYLRFVEPFLKLRARERNLAEGSFVFRIEGGPRLRLSVERGGASITEITDSASAQTAAPETLELGRLDALHFLFSPLAAHNFPAIGESVFLQSLLPLPLSFEKTDGI